jgi:4-hydroxybenzoate polyprenyltransferase
MRSPIFLGWQRAWEYGRMIKFSHSLFLLPFALSALLLAPSGSLNPAKLLWILTALVSARSAAMGFNRIADLKIDALNPRTAQRALPAGRIRLGEAWGFVLISCGVFLLSAWALNPLALALAPLALFVILGYSYTKRFTWGTHFVLGAATALAPVGAWIAVTGSLDPRILALFVAVASWVSGFDILYSCQDEAFDRQWGLHSIPARFGLRRALWTSRLLHIVAVGGFAAVGLLFSLATFYWIGMGIIGGLVGLEHVLISDRDLRRLQTAFFHINVAISICYFLSVLVERLSS